MGPKLDTAELGTTWVEGAEDIASLLSRLQIDEGSEYVMQVLDAYESAMQVYRPAEATERAIAAARQAVNGFSTSTNY